MARFDRRLVRPSVHQLVGALEEADRAAGGAYRAPRDGPGWQELLSGIRNQPEGFEQWRGPGVVNLAWWTDSRDARHFRVRGCSFDDPAFRLTWWTADSPRPPAWHIYPEHVFGRLREGKLTWHVLCHCGAGGALGAGAWRGDCCGTCFYAAQVATDPRTFEVRGPGPIFEFDGKPRLTAVSPQGKALAVAGDGPWVEVIALPAWRDCLIDPPVKEVNQAQRRRLAVGPGPTPVLAFGPDGNTLLVAGDDRVLRIRDLATWKEIDRVPAPKGLRQVIHRWDLLVLVGSGNTEIWERENASAAWEMKHDIAKAGGAAAVSLCAKWLAVGEPGVVRLWDRSARPMELYWMSRGPFASLEGLAFDARNSNLTALSFENPSSPKSENRRPVVSTWYVESSTPKVWKRPVREGKAVTLSSRGDWVVSLCGDGVRFDEVTAPERKFTLLGDPRVALTDLWFSPDSRSLATLDETGRVQLWPWHRLL